MLDGRFCLVGGRGYFLGSSVWIELKSGRAARSFTENLTRYLSLSCLRPHIGGPNNSAWVDVGSHKVMRMSRSMKNHGYERRQHIKESIKKPRPERGGERVFLGFQGAGKLALAETKQFENFPDYSNAQLRIVIWWSGVKPKYCLSKCCLESCHPIYHPSSRTKSCIKFTICSLFKFCTQCKFYIKESIGWLVLEWPTLHLELCILQWSYFEDLSNQGTCNLIYTNSTANCK